VGILELARGLASGVSTERCNGTSVGYFRDG